MTSLLTQLNSAIAKRRAYNRTVAEIKSMPLDVSLDLNVYRGDAEKLAYEAVYGI